MKFASPIVARLIALVGITTLMPCGMAAGQSAVTEQRRQAVEDLSPSAKRELLQKKKRFERLPEEEKARLRRLDAEISRHPQAPEIRRVLERYGEWLASLEAKERAVLKGLPPEKRLETILKLRQGERNRRLSKCGLTPADANTVYQWWDWLVDEHPDLLIRSLDDRSRRAIMRMDKNDPGREFRMRMSAMPSLPRFIADLPPESITRLIDELTEEAQAQYLKQESTENKSELLAKWVGESIHYRMRMPVSEPDLQRMIQRLPEEQRKQLERLPRDEIARKLREQWARQMWRRMRPPEGFRRGDREQRGPRERYRFHDADDNRPRWGWDEKRNRHDKGDDDRRGQPGEPREEVDRPADRSPEVPAPPHD